MYKEKHILNKHYGSHKLSRYIDVYELNTVNCSADKTTGYKGDTITITGTPAWNQKTSSYSVTGATLTGNQFDFTGSDVTAQANYETAKSITTQSCSANKVSGFSGDNVTVTGTPAWNQKLSGYGITGATLTGNNFKIANSNVTVQGKYETAKNVTYGTRTSGNKVSGFIGDQVTITGTPAWNEKTSSYSVTGATLTGNKFTFTGANVTAKANFEIAKSVEAHGCTVTPTSGFTGTVVTATPNPAWNEKLSSYNTTGATHTGNNFTITGNSVVISANFETAKNVTLQADGHGQIAANKTSGFIGDKVTLSNTPNANYAFSAYTLTGANLTGNKFNLTGSNVTAKAWFYYVSPTKNARIAMRFADIAPTIASAGKTYYPFVIMQDLVVTGYTGDNIDSLLANYRVARAQYYAYPLWNNGDTSTASASTTARTINFDLVDSVHLYANTGTTTAGAYEIRGRCNVNNEYIALQQYVFSASQMSAHQVNPRNIRDSNNLWIYGRGQGIPDDFNVAGSALYNDALYKCLIPVQVAYWYNSTAMCAPNTIVQHSDIIADITWTE